MKKMFSILLAALLLAACSDSDSYNPYDEQRKGDFHPANVVIKKSTPNRDITESWTNITRNRQGQVTSYEYSLEISGDISQTEKKKHTVKYYTRHDGREVIETRTDASYFKSANGISENYTRKIVETASINSNGYIDEINSIIEHWVGEPNSSEPVTTTSRRTFAYNGDFCKSSSYKDNEQEITYKYNWSGYKLKNITELKEDLKDGSIEYNTYDYTFDSREIFPYTGTNLMAFVQSGMPQIYASMGYIGKGTPYVLSEELQGGYTKFGTMTSNNIKVHNTYSFDGDANFKLAYNAFSNIYDTYSINFSK